MLSDCQAAVCYQVIICMAEVVQVVSYKSAGDVSPIDDISSTFDVFFFKKIIKLESNLIFLQKGNQHYKTDLCQGHMLQGTKIKKI